MEYSKSKMTKELYKSFLWQNKLVLCENQRYVVIKGYSYVPIDKCHPDWYSFYKKYGIFK